MDSRIRHEHIANEARRVFQITKRYDDLANWNEAIDNLNIFPNKLYYVNVPNALSESDCSMGLILPNSIFRNGHYTYWYLCREVFERDMFIYARNYESDSFHGKFKFGCMFATTEDQYIRVANFIRDIELNRLTLEELTTFMKTDRGYMHIRPSSFWTECQMRFSLFTILLRAGRFYYLNSIEDALMSVEYARRTFAAIRLFFQGRRNYIGTMSWQNKWVDHFKDLNESQITTLVY